MMYIVSFREENEEGKEIKNNVLLTDAVSLADCEKQVERVCESGKVVSYTDLVYSDGQNQMTSEDLVFEGTAKVIDGGKEEKIKIILVCPDYVKAKSLLEKYMESFDWEFKSLKQLNINDII